MEPGQHQGIRTWSCGLGLLRGPVSCFDYVIHVTSDHETYVKVLAHRMVLRTFSRRFRRLINDENYFSLVVELQPTFIGPFLELIQFMYLRDVSLLTDKKKILSLCGTLEMNTEVFAINTGLSLEDRPTHLVSIHLHFDESACVVGSEMVKLIHIAKCRATVYQLQPEASKPAVEAESTNEKSKGQADKADEKQSKPRRKRKRSPVRSGPVTRSRSRRSKRKRRKRIT